LYTTFNIPVTVTGVVLTILALIIIVGGIKTISKVSSVVVPVMAIFYIIAGLIVIVLNIQNIPAGLAQIFSMAFSVKAVSGGALGTIVASMMAGMRYGVARGCFSNEAGMGSAAITAAAATTDHPVRQAYINMTGTFWDTIVVCTITGLCIAGSGVLGSTTPVIDSGSYQLNNNTAIIHTVTGNTEADTEYTVAMSDGTSITLTDTATQKATTLTAIDDNCNATTNNTDNLVGTWKDADGAKYTFSEDGTYNQESLVKGSALTILAFQSVLGKFGGWLVCIGIALFAFSTILGWEYHGEKAFEYLFGTHKYNMVYRIIFSLIVFVGATQSLELVWNFSDIANALMAIPNLICMLLLSGEIAKDMKDFQVILKKERGSK
jgi:AGCS family alanine or glycine:cation symporter